MACWTTLLIRPLSRVVHSHSTLQMDPPPPATPPTEPAENTQPSTEPQEIDAPLVFQCASCSTIVADSFAWFESQQLLKTITLYGELFKYQPVTLVLQF
ncbi:hypothetical protein BC938DRAFT_476275 [Jimgerdemannia flammicorona]|uniref:Mis18 domain-containing protein n=1 Tax=Jimgerdemannia flammicorona TaxID=994334 RepID=A0A433QQS0_9FUNG|nr:hypothetical protein BC938DRAFT_476275 [Jimgerdemannia flammicorona]